MSLPRHIMADSEDDDSYEGLPPLNPIQDNLRLRPVTGESSATSSGRLPCQSEQSQFGIEDNLLRLRPVTGESSATASGRLPCQSEHEGLPPLNPIQDNLRLRPVTGESSATASGRLPCQSEQSQFGIEIYNQQGGHQPAMNNQRHNRYPPPQYPLPPHTHQQHQPGYAIDGTLPFCRDYSRGAGDPHQHQYNDAQRDRSLTALRHPSHPCHSHDTLDLSSFSCRQQGRPDQRDNMGTVERQHRPSQYSGQQHQQQTNSLPYNQQQQYTAPFNQDYLAVPREPLQPQGRQDYGRRRDENVRTLTKDLPRFSERFSAICSGQNALVESFTEFRGKGEKVKRKKRNPKPSTTTMLVTVLPSFYCKDIKQLQKYGGGETRKIVFLQQDTFQEKLEEIFGIDIKDYEMCKAGRNKKLVVLPTDWATPALVQTNTEHKRSALYLRPKIPSTIGVEGQSATPPPNVTITMAGTIPIARRPSNTEAIAKSPLVLENSCVDVGTHLRSTRQPVPDHSRVLYSVTARRTAISADGANKRRPSQLYSSVCPANTTDSGELVSETAGTSQESDNKEDDTRCDVASELLLNLRQSVDLDAPKNLINCSRFNVIGGATRGFNKPEFNVKRGLNVKFAGERAMDEGGPSKEFMTLTLKHIQSSYIFDGPTDSKMLSVNVIAEQKKEYLLFGKMMAYFLVHGGVAPRFFSNTLVQMVTVASLDEYEPQLEDLDDVYGELLQQIIDSDETNFQNRTEPLEEIITYCGGMSLCTFQKKNLLVKMLLRALVIQRYKNVYDQFTEGLKTLNLLTTLRIHPVSLKTLFTKQDQPLTQEEFSSFFEPKLSTIGSNNCKIECESLACWTDILIELEKDGKLNQLLQFVTGLQSPPAMGFDPPGKLLFDHSSCLNSLTLYANTCSNTLTLPAVADYNLLKEITTNVLNLGAIFTDY